MIFATVVSAVVVLQLFIGQGYHGIMQAQIDAFGPQKTGKEEPQAKGLVYSGTGTERLDLGQGSVMTHNNNYEYTSVLADLPPEEETESSTGWSQDIDSVTPGGYSYTREGWQEGTGTAGQPAGLGGKMTTTNPSVPPPLPPPPPPPGEGTP